MLTVKSSNPRKRAARRQMGMFVGEDQGERWPGGVRWMVTDLGCTGHLYPLARPGVTIGTIGVLFDDVLLEIFNIYLDQAGDIEAWHTLVHVCRQWRRVVFASPLHLNLRILYRPKRSVAMTLDIWPVVPIAVDFVGTETRPRGMHNIIAALEQHNRVCSINLRNIPNSMLEKFTAIRKPFPTLTELVILSHDEVVPVIPDSFLGGSTPQLRTLKLVGIPFPALGKLLLSTSKLVHLYLQKIPHSGYISPHAIVGVLSAAKRLQKVSLEFQSPQSWDDRASWHPPPLTRIVLPALTRLVFKGDSQYLEAIVSRIDAPLLDSLEITFFNQLMFDTPLLGHFLSRTKTFTAVHQADVEFHTLGVRITLVWGNETSDLRVFMLLILCKQPEWQLSTIAQVCNSIIPPLSTLGKLRIGEGLYSMPRWHDDMENTEWLELLQPFTYVKDLELSERLVPLVAPALQELNEERVTQTLPVLQDLSLEGPPSGAAKEAMKKFIAARRLSGHPVTMNPVGGSWPFRWNDFAFDADELGDMSFFFGPTAVHDGSSLCKGCSRCERGIVPMPMPRDPRRRHLAYARRRAPSITVNTRRVHALFGTTRRRTRSYCL